MSMERKSLLKDFTHAKKTEGQKKDMVVQTMLIEKKGYLESYSIVSLRKDLLNLCMIVTFRNQH